MRKTFRNHIVRIWMIRSFRNNSWMTNRGVRIMERSKESENMFLETFFSSGPSGTNIAGEHTSSDDSRAVISLKRTVLLFSTGDTHAGGGVKVGVTEEISILTLLLELYPIFAYGVS